MSDDFKLIKITDELIVHPTEIIRASRCGNYTDVLLRGSQISQEVWDEDKRLWNAIQIHVE